MINFNDIPKLMQVGDGQGGKALSSVAERVVRNLQAKSISTWMGVRTNVLGDPRAGFIRVRKPELLKTSNYGDGTGIFQEMNAPEIQVLINDQMSSKFDIETFDSTVVETWDQLLGIVTAGLTQSILATMNAKFYLKTKEVIDANPSMQLVIPKFSDENATPEECKADSVKWARAVASMEKTFSSYNLGTDGSQVITVIDQFGKINRINGLTTGNAGDRAIGFIVDGGAELREVWGNKYIVDGMVNNFIAKDASFTDAFDTDLMNYNGFIIHNEAVAMPWVMNDIIYVIDPIKGNPRWIAKFKSGFGVIRPELVKGIVKEAIGVQTPDNLYLSFVGKQEVAVGNDLIALPVVQPIGMSTQGLTAASSDATKATVKVENGKVIITGVAAGNTNITISIGGKTSKTYQVVVK